MKNLLLLVFLYAFSYSYSQSFLQTVDNKKFDYEKISFKKEKIQIIDKKNQKIEFNPNEVLAYYVYADDKFYYRIENDKHIRLDFSLFQLDPLNPDLKREYFFIERVLEGSIRLYRKEIITGGGTETSFSREFHWFIEEDGVLSWIRTDGSFLTGSKKKFEEFYQRMVNEPGIAEKIKSGKFKNKIEDIKRIIKIYNANKIEEGFNNQTGYPERPVTFYRDTKNQSKDKAYFTIGTQEFSLSQKEMITLDIPIDKLSKICLKNTVEETCETIKSFRYINPHFQISLDKKGRGEIKRMNSNSSYLNARLKFITNE